MKNLSKKFIIAAAAAASICASTAYATAFPCPIGAPCMFTGNTIVVQPTGGTGGGFQCPPGIMINGQICGGGSQTGSGNGGSSGGGNNGFINPSVVMHQFSLLLNKDDFIELHVNGQSIVSVAYSYNISNLVFVIDQAVKAYILNKCQNTETGKINKFIQAYSTHPNSAITSIMREIDKPITRGCKNINSSNGGNTGTK